MALRLRTHRPLPQVGSLPVPCLFLPVHPSWACWQATQPHCCSPLRLLHAMHIRSLQGSRAGGCHRAVGGARGGGRGAALDRGGPAAGCRRPQVGPAAAAPGGRARRGLTFLGTVHCFQSLPLLTFPHLPVLSRLPACSAGCRMQPWRWWGPARRQTCPCSSTTWRQESWPTCGRGASQPSSASTHVRGWGNGGARVYGRRGLGDCLGLLMSP